MNQWSITSKQDEMFHLMQSHLCLIKNMKEFLRFHYKIPFIQDFINATGKSKDTHKSDDPRIGAKWIAKYICNKYQSEINEFLQSESIAISGVMDEISAATKWTDAGVTKARFFTILQCLGSILGEKVTVRHSKIEDLHIGVTIPQTGSIE